MTEVKAAKLTSGQVASIRKGFADAGLGNHKVTSVHLTPVAGAAADDGDEYHVVTLPNGQKILVPN